MAAFAGRLLRIKYSSDGITYNAIAGARTDTLTINNERIDITDKDDAGVLTALDDIGTKGMTISVTGVLKDATLATLADSAAAGAALHDFEIEVGSGTPIRTYQAMFFIDSFEIGGEQAGEGTFTATLSSSGTVTAS